MESTTVGASAAVSSVQPVITIEGKQFGRGKTLFPSWQMPLPEGDVFTLRDFLVAVVRHEVAAFRERQEKRQVLSALTAEAIAEGAARGKVDMGGRPETSTEVDEDAAIHNAIQSFEDGLYYVFVDNEQQTDLSAVLPLRDGSQVLFLRLVALAGG
ncbi:MAG: hypothetical protein OHK0029_22990 [Armatimonadaceae bacterium]